ncbi:hypothetical protein HZB02_02690 [Candidatus Woesearchaeota archaeon]|nr:hypothetical protein [Candidatus Woesearchaeota archaeon]
MDYPSQKKGLAGIVPILLIAILVLVILLAAVFFFRTPQEPPTVLVNTTPPLISLPPPISLPSLTLQQQQHSPFSLRFGGLASDKEIALMHDLGVYHTRTLLMLDGGYFGWVSNLSWEQQEQKILQRYDQGIYSTGYLPGYSVDDSELCHAHQLECWKSDELGLLKTKQSICAPCDEEAYMGYIQKVVERFDGDGIDDAPGHPKILDWQLGDNEGDARDTPIKAKEYAKTVMLTYKGLKAACSNCRLILMSSFFNVKSLLQQGECVNGFSPHRWTFFPDDSCAPKDRNVMIVSKFVGTDRSGDGYFYRLFGELNKLKQSDPSFSSSTNTYFDTYAFHFYEHPDGYKALPKAIATAQRTFGHFGFTNISIVIPEFDTYSGRPKVSGAPSYRHPDNVDVSIPKSLQDHARDVIKRHLTAIGNGVRWVDYSGGIDVERNDPNLAQKSLGWCSPTDIYFCTTSLLAADGTKKPAYYAYRKMVQLLDGSDWEKTQVLEQGSDAYLYAFVKGNKTIYAGWSDGGYAATIPVSGQQWTMIDLIPTDDQGTLSSSSLASRDGSLSVSLMRDPVVIVQVS